MSADQHLRAFIDAAKMAFDAQVTAPAGRQSCARIFEELDGPITVRGQTPERLPVCDLLAQATRPEMFAQGPLRSVVEAFNALEPHLKWRRRAGDRPKASANFEDNHVLSMIVGPGGLMPHAQVYLGVNFQAPNVRYPDHTHPPEETYLVLSDSEFSQDGETWFPPGIGGTFYNPPGILHAMRSGDTPLFAMWALWAERE